MATATAETPLLECVGVSKAFGAVQALYRVDFEVRRGEVMALVGDNGAGKSTLIKSVAGIYPFDEGEVRFEGEHVDIHGPRDSAKLGIEVVYQDLALADNLDVVANMFLGRERVRTGVVLDESSMERSAARDARQPLGDHAALGPADGWPASPAASGRRSRWRSRSCGTRSSSSSTSPPRLSAWPRRARCSTSSAAWPSEAWAS